MPRHHGPGQQASQILIRRVQHIMNRILGRLAAGAAGATLPAVLAASAMASTCPPDAGYGPDSAPAGHYAYCYFYGHGYGDGYHYQSTCPPGGNNEGGGQGGSQ